MAKTKTQTHTEIPRGPFHEGEFGDIAIPRSLEDDIMPSNAIESTLNRWKLIIWSKDCGIPGSGRDGGADSAQKAADKKDDLCSWFYCIVKRTEYTEQKSRDKKKKLNAALMDFIGFSRFVEFIDRIGWIYVWLVSSIAFIGYVSSIWAFFLLCAYCTALYCLSI